MKNTYTIFLILISNLLFSQNEQLSLNYFAKELLPKIENCKVYFDGKINDKKHYKKEVLENIVIDYYYCKYDGRNLNNSEFKIQFLNLEEIQAFSNVEKSITTKLITPTNIKFKKEIKYKKRLSGKFLVRLNKIFTPKYILNISPSIEIENNLYLTVVHLNKIDNSEGLIYYIITKNNIVIDWCESGWIT